VTILFSSFAYAPGIGGIETVSALLAHEFVAVGHQVTLITETPGTAKRADLFPIVRRPSFFQLTRLVQHHNVVFQNNVCLRHLLPALLARKPVLVVHQTWIRNSRGQIGWNGRIKRALLPRVRNVAISQAIATDFGQPMEVVGNPYDDSTFKIDPSAPRERAIIFVGRLVSDKGADILLEAFCKLRKPGATLTIVGCGPEETGLRRLTQRLQIEDRVVFAGAKSGADLAALLNRHRILIVPSRWPEPFGVVALEGIACGCAVVGSEQGGLKEAIGPCGRIFPNGNAEALTNCLEELLENEKLQEKFCAAAPGHLAKFRARAIAARYLAILEELVT